MVVGDDRPWSDAGRDAWLRAVDVWLEEVLSPVGEQRERVEWVKARPWGAVLRVQTSSRSLYFKALGPRGRHELRLLVDIAQRSPGLTPDVIASHHDEGWLLMADHGRALVDLADAAGQVDAIEGLLPAYATVQRCCAGLVDGWIAAGVPDRSPGRLPELLEGLLAGRGAMGPLAIDSREARRCRSLLGELTAVCDELRGSPPPRSVDHADLHSWNVLVDGDVPRLIDWGDACIAHPFSSLLVPIEWVAGRLPPGEQAAAIERLCDAYLTPWDRAGDRRLLGLAVWVAYVARALSNDEQCAGGSAAVVRDGRREIVALLRAWVTKADRLDRPPDLLQPVLEL